MLYLEDYLEIIEHLPQELRDRFTEMREMDLQVQNAMDNLEERVKQFFINAKKQKNDQREVEYERIRQDYYKALEDADEKVHIANQIYDLVDRYLRRLDQELQKFKLELEADNAGITEILERRSLELDNPPPALNNIKGEKRKHHQIGGKPHMLTEKRASTEKQFNALVAEVVKETGSVRSAPSSHSSSSLGSSPSPSVTFPTNGLPAAAAPSNPLAYGLGAGNHAIAAAASQAIAATQQVRMQQGRRTASLKASYEAINSGFNLSREFTIGSREIGSLHPVPPTPEPKRTKKQSRTSQAQLLLQQQQQQQQQLQQIQQQQPQQVEATEESEDSIVFDENGQPLEWSYDPNEPRYCICNQVSYGDMVACDNEDCPFEWFHYPCVGISQPPKGKWFCPQCISTMKRRGRKDKAAQQQQQLTS